MLWPEDFEEEEACADDDAGVGDVEVGPIVVVDLDGEEFDYVVEADAVVEIAERSTKDEGKREELNIGIYTLTVETTGTIRR